jgi:hypothetical protein
MLEMSKAKCFEWVPGTRAECGAGSARGTEARAVGLPLVVRASESACHVPFRGRDRRVFAAGTRASGTSVYLGHAVPGGVPLRHLSLRARAVPGPGFLPGRTAPTGPGYACSAPLRALQPRLCVLNASSW